MTAAITQQPAVGSTAEQTVAAVRDALRRVVDPCSIATGVPIAIEDMGLVKGIRVSGADVVVELRVTSPFCMQIGNLRSRIDEVTRGLHGVACVSVEVDDGNDWLPSMMRADVQSRLRRVRPLLGPAPLEGEE